MRAVIFALALYHAYDVPPVYGERVFVEAVNAGVNPFEAGALLMAENKSRRYDPTTVGRHGAGGELGLFQLAPYPWARFCELAPADLKVPHRNIACAAKVIRHMQEKAGIQVDHPFWREALVAEDDAALRKGMRRATRDKLEWQTRYRCHPTARSTPACTASVNRVLRMHALLLDTYAKRHTAAFWWATLQALPDIIALNSRAAAAGFVAPYEAPLPTLATE
jgi:hypothetical protein